MKIVNVECDYLLVDVPIPVRETTTEYGVLLVTLEADNGLKGYGFAREHELHALAVRQLIVNDLTMFLKRFPDIPTPEFVWHEAAFDLPRSDYRIASGITARAASAVDQALWDLRGKALQEPVWRLLGGAQPEVEIYATFGLNIYNPEEETEAARRLKEQGFTSFKLQGSDADRGRDLSVDSGRVRRLRETVGDDARVILDGRNIYSLFQAIELTKMLEPYNMAFFDEPLYAKDPLGMRQLREACPGVPLAARGRGGNIWDNRDLMTSGVLGVMGVSVMDQGGITQSIKIAHAAEMFHLPVATGGGWHLQNAHLIAGVTNGWMTEYHALAAGVGDALFVDPVQPKSGKIKLSEKPGMGIELDRDAVKDARKRAEVAVAQKR